jgi:hypothetical protein
VPVASAPRVSDGGARDPERERTTFGGAPSSSSRGTAGRGRAVFDRAPRPERSGERPERAERSAGAERPERGPRPERGDRPERAALGPRPERSERPERAERGPRPERAPRGTEIGFAPVTARTTDSVPPAAVRGTAAPAPEREFWEVWSEERGALSSPSESTSGEAVGAGGFSAGSSDNSGAAAEPIAAPSPTPFSTSGFGPRVTEVSASSSSSSSSSSFARLYLNLGRKDGANDEQVRELITTHAGPVTLEGMDIMNTHTYLNVSPDDADRLCMALTGQAVGGRDLVCERAKPRRS